MRSGLNNLYQFGNFRLDTHDEMLWRDGELVSLSPKAMGLLKLLIEREGGIVTKQEIFDHVWAGTFVEEGVLTQNIYTLRNTLGQDDDGKQFIETVRGRGYRFAARVIVDGEAEIAINGGEPPGAALKSRTAAGIRGDSATSSADVRRPVVRTALFAVIGLIILSAGVIGVFRWWRPAESGRRPEYAPIEQLRVQRLTDSGDVIHPTISPNGEFLAYVRVEDNGHSVWVKQIATDSSTRTTLPPSSDGYRSLSFSPDGNYLFFRELSNPGSVFQVPLFGGTKKKVADNAWSDFSVSPDGKQLAFVRRDFARQASLLILSNLDDGKERELSSRPATGGYGSGAPAWSPDGSRVIVSVSSTEEARPVLFNVDVATGEQSELPTPKWREITRCLWLPNMKQIVVAARSHDEPGSQLWRLDVPEGTVSRLTNDLESYFWLSLSADGKMLVTRQQRMVAHLWSFENGDPKKAKQLTAGERNQDGQSGLAVLPDDRILFSAFAGKTTDIHSINLDGGNRMQLTGIPGRDSNWPSPSADGGRIAFVSPRTGHRQVWLMNPDGTNQTQLTFGEKLTDAAFGAAMSPDGREVFYMRTGKGPISIWKVPVEGGAPVQVSHLKDATTEGFLSVSPDGKWLAYQHVSNTVENLGEERAIVIGVIPSDGAAEPKLFNLPLRRPLVKWTPDSKSFYYSAGTFNASSFWRQPIDGGPAEKIFDLPDRLFNFAWSTDGSILVVSRGRMIGEALLITNFSD